MAGSEAAADLHREILSQALHIVPDRLAFLCGPSVSLSSLQQTFPHHTIICIDEELVYEPFYSDFGPLNLGHTYDFCMRVLDAMEKVRGTGRPAYVYSGAHAWLKANATVLVGIFHVLYMPSTSEKTWELLSSLGPFNTFRDASTGPSLMPLTIDDVLKGMRAAHKAGFLPWVGQADLFDLEEYRHYEQVQNGDLNWVIPNKIIAFAGPSRKNEYTRGYKSWRPEDYWNYFSRSDVTDVVRLNNDSGRPGYEASQFVMGGYNHHDLCFPDGTCPTDDIVEAFLQICESSEGVVAIHCKAGLGRTGVLIGLYLMKHYSFTAKEAVAYLRVCRPGSVIGQQQTFLEFKENVMWQSGQEFREASQGKKHCMALIEVPPQGPPAPRVTLPPLTTCSASLTSAVDLDGMYLISVQGPGAGGPLARPISVVSAEEPTAVNSAPCHPPPSPAKASMPTRSSRAAKASPHWMATNGQPRKGYNPAADAGTSSARKLQFAMLPTKTAKVVNEDSSEWLIPAVPKAI